MSARKCNLLLATTGLALIVGLHARLVPAQQATAADHPSSELEEVIVTSERRAENLQDVPISTVVYSGTQLAQQNVNSLQDLSSISPSIRVSPAARSQNLYMRGIGSGQNQVFDQSVATFVDDVYYGRGRLSAAAYFDLEHIEILKGPQSTFFGNNAIAGAFNITSRKPARAFDGSARLLYGSHGRYVVEGAAGGAINDVLAVRIAATANGTEGWLRNINTGDKVPQEDNRAARVTLAYTPSEDFDATFKAESSSRRQKGGILLQGANCPPPAPFSGPAGFCSIALAVGSPTDPDDRLTGSTPGEGTRLDLSSYVLNANYRRWRHTFTSVTAFYDYDNEFAIDLDIVPAFLSSAYIPEHYHQFSQELRVTSPSDGPLEYIFGAYFQTDRLSLTQDQSFPFLNATIAAAPALVPLRAYLPLASEIQVTQPEDSYAAFGSATWSLTDRLKLTGGLRSTWVSKSFTSVSRLATATQPYGGLVRLPENLQTLASAVGVGRAFDASDSRDDQAWLPSVRAQYMLTPSAMTYVSYALGFKAGGFNALDSTGTIDRMPFDPEHVKAFEAGLKSKWLDNSLLINLALFHSEYRDLQVTTNIQSAAGSSLSLISNAARSRTQGMELEARWAINSKLQSSANVAYINAYYRDFRSVPPTQQQTLALRTCTAANPAPSTVCQSLATQDLSGRPPPFSPRWSGNVSTSYRFDLASNYRLTTEATGLFSTAYYTDSLDDPLMRQRSYIRLDARMTLEDPNNRWAVDIIGKNLNSRAIKTYGTVFPSSLGSSTEQREEPRNLALQVRLNW